MKKLALLSISLIITIFVFPQRDTDHDWRDRVIIWEEGFEGSLSHLNFYKDCATDCIWGDVSCESHTGNWSLWCADDGAQAPSTNCSNYIDNMCAYVEMGYPGIDISGYTNVKFKFYLKNDSENTYDHIYFSISNTNSNPSSWILLGSHSGTTGGYWTQGIFDVPDDWNTLYWQFHFVSDNSISNYEGAYIDDIQITGNAASPQLLVTPTSIDLGTHQPGYVFTSQFTVKNTGSGTLTGTVSENASWITNLSPTSFSLGANQQANIQFSGSFPAQSGYFGTNITVNSNGGNQNVDVHGVAATPFIDVSPTSLSFGNVTVGQSSTSNYQLTGSNLTANVTVNAPTGYQVSKQQSSGFSNQITVQQSGGSVNQTIYVKFTPPAAQTYNGNVTNSSTGATTKNVSVTGTGVLPPTPTISVNPSSLAFGNVTVGQSSTLNYQLSGSNLTANVTVNAPTGYQVSKQPTSGFANQITVAQSGGNVNQTIYVKFTPPAAQTYNGNITNSSTGASTKNVSVTGIGVLPTINVNPVSLNFGNVTVGQSSTLNYQLTGSNLTANVTVSAPTGYQVSKQPSSGFDNQITVTQSGGNVNQTIYVKFTPTAAQTYNGNVTNSSTGATTKNVSVTATGVLSTINVEPSSLDFGDVTVGQSSTLNYQLSGSNLTANVTVNAPNGYQVSKQPSSGFANQITVTQSGGNVNQTKSVEREFYHRHLHST